MKLIRQLIILSAIVLLSGVAIAQPAVNRAGVVARFGNGDVVTACVEFSEPSISGLELLERSGLPVISQRSSIGAAVCKIGNEGCDYPATSCFCAREQGRVVYWAFYVREGGTWRYSNLGASNVSVSDGDLHGWAWGPGDASGGAMPPEVELADVCRQAAVIPPAAATTAPATNAAPTATIPPAATIAHTATAIPTATNTPPMTAAPSLIASLEPSATLASATATLSPVATASATAAVTFSPTFTPTATITSVTPVTADGNAGQWLGFVALAALLIGGIAVTLRRRQ
ncbi:hypothetical protein [Chloroflexus sp.]|uniref:hypothetical protein n=1 Tax=Chloroflexus sp. TaxID=1904827 RepID=UPI0026391824|nr:hypothetical protein [uncultured Chloroflexus sp.]